MKPVEWSPVLLSGDRSKVKHRVALIPKHPGRFALYQSKAVPTMWSILDVKSNTTHFLYVEGGGWDEAMVIAGKRIEKILARAESKPVKPKPTVKKRAKAKGSKARAAKGAKGSELG